MNILFVIPSLAIGGVEKVSCILANKFVAENHKVGILCVKDNDETLLSSLDSRISVFYTNKNKKIGLGNIRYIHHILKENDFQIIINQFAQSPFIIFKLYLACIGKKTKIITEHHNDPLMSGRVQRLEIIKKKESGLRLQARNIEISITKELFKGFMWFSYHLSDMFLLLSERFCEPFKQYVHIKNPKKLDVQTNPITIQPCLERADNLNKKKQILFVGRLDETQKRISRILSLWNIVHTRIPDWKLLLIGDGPDRNKYEEYIVSHALPNVQFEGFQNPISYYKESSIILLTSQFEGFSLILPESMSYGVIPIVLGSYEAVYDIIENEKSGFIIKPPFDENIWADLLTDLISSPTRMKQMSLNAQQGSIKFNTEYIYKQWEKKLMRLE